MEAFHYRFHPLFARVIEILRTGEIGAIRNLRAHFRVPIAFDDEELRYHPELGGGALMDLGCYPVHWVRTLIGEDPVVLSAEAELHRSGVDTGAVRHGREPSGQARRQAFCDRRNRPADRR
jgi:predicted dehydrogenase